MNVIQIDLPPLAGRPDDVELLAGNMLKFFAAQNHKNLDGFMESALLALRTYSWPGNVRELRNVVERAVILSKVNLLYFHGQGKKSYLQPKGDMRNDREWQ